MIVYTLATPFEQLNIKLTSRDEGEGGEGAKDSGA